MRINAERGDVTWDPMPGKIVVRLMEEKEYSEHLVVPPRYQKVKVIGEVLAIGDEEDESSLQVGDTVCFSPTSGVCVAIGRDEVVVFKTSEILARVSWKPKLLST